MRLTIDFAVELSRVELSVPGLFRPELSRPELFMPELLIPEFFIPELFRSEYLEMVIASLLQSCHIFVVLGKNVRNVQHTSNVPEKPVTL